MRITQRRVKRYSASIVGAAALVLTIGGVGLAAGGGGANGAAAAPSAATVIVPPVGPPLRFVAVTPCRIIDTRVAGGALNASARTFTADGPYTSQGGNPLGCAIPPNVAVAVQVNLGAIAAGGAKGWAKAWAAGTTEPLASIINYPADAPISNMVTIPVSTASNFNIKTANKAQIFADIAGYYVKSLYVAVTPSGSVYSGISSGVVSTSRWSMGIYLVKFDRSVQACAAATNDITFATNSDVSADVGYPGITSDPNTVTVEVTNAANTLVDTYFTLSLTC